MKKDAVINGFRMCGIFPLNADNIHFDRCIAVAASEPTIISPIISQTSKSANVIAIGTNQMEVDVINQPEVDDIFISTSTDWDYALQTPFIIDSDVPQEIPIEITNEMEQVLNQSKTDQSVTTNQTVETRCNRALDIVTTIKLQLEELNTVLPTDRSDVSSTVVLMNQMCDFLIQNVSNEPGTLLSHQHTNSSNILREPKDLNHSIKHEPSSKKTVANMLKRPPRPERAKNHRSYGKIPKCGVMSSDEIVQQFEEDQQEKENLNNKKQERQKEILGLQNQIKLLKQNQKEENNVVKERKLSEITNRLKTVRTKKRKIEN